MAKLVSCQGGGDKSEGDRKKRAGAGVGLNAGSPGLGPKARLRFDLGSMLPSRACRTHRYAGSMWGWSAGSGIVEFQPRWDDIRLWSFPSGSRDGNSRISKGSETAYPRSARDTREKPFPCFSDGEIRTKGSHPCAKPLGPSPSLLSL